MKLQISVLIMSTALNSLASAPAFIACKAPSGKTVKLTLLDIQEHRGTAFKEYCKDKFLKYADTCFSGDKANIAYLLGALNRSSILGSKYHITSTDSDLSDLARFEYRTSSSYTERILIEYREECGMAHTDTCYRYPVYDEVQRTQVNNLKMKKCDF